VGKAFIVTELLLFAVPPAVVTLTVPLDPEAPIATISVELLTVKEEAGVPPILTAVTPVKFVPVIIIEEPAQTEASDIDEIAGAGVVYVIDK